MGVMRRCRAISGYLGSKRAVQWGESWPKRWHRLIPEVHRHLRICVDRGGPIGPDIMARGKSKLRGITQGVDDELVGSSVGPQRAVRGGRDLDNLGAAFSA